VSIDHSVSIDDQVGIDDPVAGIEMVSDKPVSAGATGLQPVGEGRSAPSSSPPSLGPRRLAQVLAGWTAIAVVGAVIVVYFISPLFAQRDQHRRLVSYRVVLQQSSREASGLFGFTLPTQPPDTGSTVGILEIGRLQLQEAVTEGVGPAQTESGPGHVPGTAGLGQPGNAAVVARHTAYGGPWGFLSSLRHGDPIVVTTTEGQSLYVVSNIRSVRLRSEATIAGVYGPSTGNHLTLVTSISDVPWNTADATVVVATMRTKPFTPTPQQSRIPGEDGRSAEPQAWAPFILALQAFALVAAGAMVLYRRVPLRTAYLLSTAPLVVVTVLLAIAGSRLMPAWT
jgi:sortase A